MSASDFHQRFPWVGGDFQTICTVVLPRVVLSPGRLVCGDSDGKGLTPGIRYWFHDVPAKVRYQESFFGEFSGLPPVLLIHGLGGCEDSASIRRAASYYGSCGFPVFRASLPGSLPTRPAFCGHIHGGSVEGIQVIVDDIVERFPRFSERGLFLVGLSLGGAMVARLLGLAAGNSFSTGGGIRAAMTVSAPFDLHATSDWFERPRNHLYRRWLMGYIKKAIQTGDLSVSERLATARARSVRALDETFVAPHFGFANAEDYYEKASALRHLAQIKVPLLVVHAVDDAWVPVDCAQAARRIFSQAREGLPLESSPDSPTEPLGSHTRRVVITKHGGHVGFHATGHSYAYHDRLGAQFFKHYA